jgi:hypothetical protein
MGEEGTVSKRMDEDKVEYSTSGSDDKEYDNDNNKLESGEFNSHCGDRCTSDAVYSKVFFFNILSSPPNPCKCRSSSPRGSPISIRRVLQR